MKENLYRLAETYVRALLRSMAQELRAYPYSRWKGKHEAEDRVVATAKALVQSPTFVEDSLSVCKFLDPNTVRYVQGTVFRIARIACFEAIIVEAHKAHATERRSTDEHLSD